MASLVVVLMWPRGRKDNRDRNALEVAQVIERFLDGNSLYPQEWNDFVESSLRDKKLDVYRKRCDELDPLVNRPGDPDPDAVSELRSLIETLRSQQRAG